MILENQTIKKSMAINAPKEKVWKILLDADFTRIWYAEFGEGVYAVTDWKIGSKAVFTDKAGNGIAGMVIENKPHELIAVEYHGVVKDGVEDYESDVAQQVKGTIESYRLSEKNGRTQLSVKCDMGDEYFDMMSQAWDRAIQKIKTLAEK